LNSKYLYLSLDLIIFIVPFAASFQKNAPFFKKWKFLGIAIIITSLFFIIWDEVFTQEKVWGFNEKYVTGIFLGSLPLEEILFFICVPYACVFTYFVLNHAVEKDHLFPHQELISSALIILLLIAGIYNIDKWYTGVTFITLALFLAYQMLKIKPRYMGRFYFAFAVLLVPFFIFNSILTGTFIDDSVVWYNDAHTLGMRIGTIPLEDFFYALLLIVMNIAIVEWLEERAYYRKKK
jgi:lycopene cyclase domain-containing protein